MKAIVTGAELITGGWTATNMNGATVYRASLGRLSDLGGGYNQVFVDGKLMIEARWPNATNSACWDSAIGFDMLNANRIAVAWAKDGTANRLNIPTATQGADYWKDGRVEGWGCTAEFASAANVTGSGSGYVTIDKKALFMGDTVFSRVRRVTTRGGHLPALPAKT